MPQSLSIQCSLIYNPPLSFSKLLPIVKSPCWWCAPSSQPPCCVPSPYPPSSFTSSSCRLVCPLHPPGTSWPLGQCWLPWLQRCSKASFYLRLQAPSVRVMVAPPSCSNPAPSQQRNQVMDPWVALAKGPPAQFHEEELCELPQKRPLPSFHPQSRVHGDDLSVIVGRKGGYACTLPCHP